MNSDLVQQKIRFLRSDPDIRSGKPDMPVAVAVQEAFNLYEFCRDDRERLVKAGLDGLYVDDLLVRATALIELQTVWMEESRTSNEYRDKWKEEFSKASALRKELLHIYHFVFKQDRIILESLRKICRGRRIDEFIQSMSSLAQLGTVHREILEKSGASFRLVEKTREMGEKLTGIYSRAKSNDEEGKEGPVVRNRAFYHLREAVEQIRRTGRFVFHKKGRYKAYTSHYMAVKGRKRRKSIG
jgi:hypothetical protein